MGFDSFQCSSITFNGSTTLDSGSGKADDRLDFTLAKSVRTSYELLLIVSLSLSGFQEEAVHVAASAMLRIAPADQAQAGHQTKAHGIVLRSSITRSSRAMRRFGYCRTRSASLTGATAHTTPIVLRLLLSYQVIELQHSRAWANGCLQRR